MRKVSVFIDGYNLYHAINNLGNNHFKWINLASLSKEFIQSQDEKIIRILFFTAFPSHKPLDVQERYSSYTTASKEMGVEIIEGKFKKKFFMGYNKAGLYQQRETHEEKETDVNIALHILEDAYETISDKIILISNDSDIAPALRMAKTKNTTLKLNIVTPPLSNGRRPNFDLAYSSLNIKKDRKGQIFFKTRMIQEIHLIRHRLPEEMTTKNGQKIIIPEAYK